MRVFVNIVDSCMMLLLLVVVLVVPALAAPEEVDDGEFIDAVGLDEPSEVIVFPDVIDVRVISDPSSDYMPLDAFLETYGDDYSIETYALQTVPTSPVTAASANGLKQVVLSLLGDYSPVITQYRYQSNTSTNYTYVNDIQLDYPWLTSAAIFLVVLYCCIRLGAAMLCKR